MTTPSRPTWTNEIVMVLRDTGERYTSLSAWEDNTAYDLTSGVIRLTISHVSGGGLSNGDTCYAYDSGDTYTASHTWNTEGSFILKAKAKDSYNAESDWATYTVTIPRNKIFYYSLFLKLLDRFTSIQELLDILGRYN